jgi:hypothetical protein
LKSHTNSVFSIAFSPDAKAHRPANRKVIVGPLIRDPRPEPLTGYRDGAYSVALRRIRMQEK